LPTLEVSRPTKHSQATVEKHLLMLRIEATIPLQKTQTAENRQFQWPAALEQNANTVAIRR